MRTNTNVQETQPSIGVCYNHLYAYKPYCHNIIQFTFISMILQREMSELENYCILNRDRKLYWTANLLISRGIHSHVKTSCAMARPVNYLPYNMSTSAKLVENTELSNTWNFEFNL